MAAAGELVGGKGDEEEVGAWKRERQACGRNLVWEKGETLGFSLDRLHF